MSPFCDFTNSMPRYKSSIKITSAYMCTYIIMCKVVIRPLWSSPILNFSAPMLFLFTDLVTMHAAVHEYLLVAR
eukprot:COSAG05_NODE_2686_length_2770_cov_1.786971_1_plen_74_part_00